MCDPQALQELLMQKDCEVAALRTRILDLRERLDAANQRADYETNKVNQFSYAMEKYDEALTEMQTEKQQFNELMKQNVDAVARERDELAEVIQSQEAVLADLLTKYDKCKDALRILQENEEGMNEAFQAQQKAMMRHVAQTDQVKQCVAQQLHSANLELEAVQRGHTVEVAQFQACMRRLQVQMQTLEHSLQCKTKEYDELSAICDQLIARAGAGKLC